jgi:DNA-binding response OmpR family regulator
MKTATIGNAAEDDNVTARLKILIVDDDDLMLMMLADMLSDDFEVVGAMSGEEALRTSESEMPAAILLDVDLPGIDGYETCRRLKAAAATARIPVIFISGFESDDERQKGLLAGGADYVVKPVQPSEIREKVVRLLAA